MNNIPYIPYIPYTPSTERVLARREGAALHIVFNNPAKHNALSVDMWGAVPALLAQAATDDDLRVVVFSGAGDKAFVSGADISQFEDQRAAREAVARYEALAEEALLAIEHSKKPTLASIDGYCIGGGVNVALACDLRIASSRSTFAIPAARLGLGYRYSALKNLVDLVGVGAAKDLFLTARRIDAKEALRLGLISRVADDLAALQAEYVQAISDNAPLTIRAAKVIIDQIVQPAPTLDQALCTQLIQDCFQSADYTEGRTAFMEKRKPVFKGR